ncbi:LysR substrate-binding domain-containing protein [Thioclava sp. 'Guangxiensis']|uniref:LysR substrate-binding domain-containing protein n=1 Tax=Thioclava sp. 'Guangxiensis' TaxID=3149044 RepID=UPI003877E809
MIPPRLTADGLAGLLRLAAQTGVKAGTQSAQFGKLLQEIGKTGTQANAAQQVSEAVKDAATQLAKTATNGTTPSATTNSSTTTQQSLPTPTNQPALVQPQATANTAQNAAQNAAQNLGQNVSQQVAQPARAMTDSLQPALIQAALLASRSAATHSEKRAQDRTPLAGQVGFVSQEKPFLGELGLPLNTVKQVYGRDAEFIRPLTGDPVMNEQENITRTPLWIGAIPSFAGWLLPEILRGLHEITPRLLRGDQPRLLQALAEGRIEVALVHDANLPETLARVPLVQLSAWVLLPKDHPLTAFERLTPQDLEDAPMIGLSLPPARDLLPNILRAEGVEPNLVEEFPDEVQILNAVAQGQGYSLRAASPLSPPDIAERRITTRPLDLRTGAVDQSVLVYRRDAGHSVAAEHFIQRAKTLAGT